MTACDRTIIAQGLIEVGLGVRRRAGDAWSGTAHTTSRRKLSAAYFIISRVKVEAAVQASGEIRLIEMVVTQAKIDGQTRRHFPGIAGIDGPRGNVVLDRIVKVEGTGCRVPQERRGERIARCSLVIRIRCLVIGKAQLLAGPMGGPVLSEVELTEGQSMAT